LVDIKKKKEIEKGTSAQDKQMPDRMHEARPLCIIKNHPKGVEQSANQQKSKGFQ